MEQKTQSQKPVTKKESQKPEQKPKVDKVLEARQLSAYKDYVALYQANYNMLNLKKTPDIKLKRKLEDLKPIVMEINGKKAKNTCTVGLGSHGTLKMVKDVPIPKSLTDLLDKKHHSTYFL